MRHSVINHPIQLKSGEQREIALFDTGLSRCVAREILDGHAYALLPFDVLEPDSVTTIFDVGANVGASCIYWLDNYPNARVFAYEPCLDSYSLLCANTGMLNVVTHGVALGAEDGFTNLYHNVEDDVCNSLTNHKSHGHEKVVIERARHHIFGAADIVKIDTEGSEYEILADIEAWLVDIKVLYLEYHSEHHRRLIDELLSRTHTLWCSQSERPHRGTLCVVRNDLIPTRFADWAIE